MDTQEIVQKLWGLCDVLMDDGITYHQYVTELTYILFLKMAKETGAEENIPEDYRWDNLREKEGTELKQFYRKLLVELPEETTGKVEQIYADAKTNIDEPKNLEKIIKSIDELNWYEIVDDEGSKKKEENIASLYEGLLEKNANEKKSGAGQYFTPRPLIDVIVELIDPKPGEKCNDPAAGTFGFMIAADRHVKEKTDDYFDLSQEEAEFQRQEAFTGCELVKDTHRLGLMNAILHGIEGKLYLGDTLSNFGKRLTGYDVVLTNPPFGTKMKGERATRDDFTYPTSNKQLNFLQHIYRSLKKNGQARAGVVLPDNVLFESNDGQDIRKDLLNKCNLHTILRLPTGIFYSRGVTTNVLFFTRGKTDKNNTEGVWIYDLRTNMPSFGKTSPLKHKHFEDFIEAYQAEDRTEVDDKRWSYHSIEEIEEKDYNLDIGLIQDDDITTHEDLPEPIEATKEAIGELEEASGLLDEVLTELQEVEGE